MDSKIQKTTTTKKTTTKKSMLYRYYHPFTGSRFEIFNQEV